MGRTAISCDDGQSWIHDTSLDDDARCFTDGLDCDHHAGSGKGLAWAPDGEGGGHFFATFGWGQPGGIDRSSDGVTWERKLGDTTFGGLAFMDDTLVAGSRTARVSGDRGETFSAGIDTGLNGWNARRAGVAGGRFVLVGDDSDVVWSEVFDDNGCMLGIACECGGATCEEGSGTAYCVYSGCTNGANGDVCQDESSYWDGTGCVVVESAD